MSLITFLGTRCKCIKATDEDSDSSVTQQTCSLHPQPPSPHTPQPPPPPPLQSVSTTAHLSAAIVASAAATPPTAPSDESRVLALVSLLSSPPLGLGSCLQPSLSIVASSPALLSSPSINTCDLRCRTHHTPILATIYRRFTRGHGASTDPARSHHLSFSLHV